MFVGDEVLLDVSFAVARARLVNLTRGGWLLSTSEDAYDLALSALPEAGALGPSRLARVHVRELTDRDDSSGLAIRWQAAGPDGGQSPVLDADITLIPAGTHATFLTVAGAYRPLASPGQEPERAIVHTAGVAAIRNFLSRVAAGITGQPALAETGTAPSLRPCAPKTA